MSIVQAGSTNLTAQIVPNILVNILPPALAFLNGVASNILGVVGAASWGPLNSPGVVSSYPDYKRGYGDLATRKFDMGTHVAIAVLQGAANFRCSRVSDGTDVAATATLSVGVTPTLALLFTALYTGVVGNTLQYNFGPGTAAGSWRLSITRPGYQAEVFDNVTGAGAALWANFVAAINTGANQAGGPSKLVIASLSGTPVVAPVVGASVTGTLAGGTDGATNLTNGMLIGVDGSPRTGIYALRGSGCAVIDVADMTDLTQFSVIASLCINEGFYGVLAAVAGECSGGGGTGTVTADSASIAVDTFAIKAMVGDWVLWNDPISGAQRFVSPAPFLAGALVNLSPEQSALNLPLFGVVATQTTQAGKLYSDAELAVIAAARMDVITSPSVGGQYYASRIGINMSSNATIHGDNYSRLTPYIARTFNAGLGKWIGKLQSAAQRLQARAQINAFFQAMQDAGQIGNADGTTPFYVTLDSTNNPQSQVALGYEQADAAVTYLSVIEHFLLNLTGGQSVQIASAANQTPAQTAVVAA